MKERDAGSLCRGVSGLVLHIISERVEPGEHAGIPFPRRWFAACGGAEAPQCLALRFEIGLRVMVRRVEADVSEPAADHIHLDAGFEEMDGRRVP